jgi:hypothetical protein
MCRMEVVTSVSLNLDEVLLPVWREKYVVGERYC